MTTTLHPPTRIVVVTGPPASGKTTLAVAISEHLGIPLIAKDGIKERLYEAFGSGDREWSRWLGRGTYPLIFHFLEAHLRVGCSVVVEGTFGPEISNAEFAALQMTPIARLIVQCVSPDSNRLSKTAGVGASPEYRARHRVVAVEVRSRGRWEDRTEGEEEAPHRISCRLRSRRSHAPRRCLR